MNIKEISLTEKAFEDRDYRDMYVIEMDGKKVFRVFDGEPEDNSLSRNFSDCYSIINVIKKAYEAGKNKEDLNIEAIRVDEF